MRTTCFGPCTGPSSGLTCVGGDYTVCILQSKVAHYNFNGISFCGTVLLAKL